MKYINRFVIPESMLFMRVMEYKERNIIPIIDYAIENNITTSVFKTTFTELLKQYPNNYHTIRLSDIDFSKNKMADIAKVASIHNNKLIVEAEQVNAQHMVNNLTDCSILSNNSHVIKTYQMYHKDSIKHLLNDIEYFTSMNKVLNVKLERGSFMYCDKYTGAIYDTKDETDKAYDYAIDIMKAYEQDVGKIIFVTHNKKSFEKINYMKGDNCFHGCLMGFDAELNWKCNFQKMVIVHCGPYHRTLSYLLAKLYENPTIFR